MTTSVRRQLILSKPKQIPVQLLLYMTTIFFGSQMKKAYLKQQLTNFIQQRNAKER